MCTINFDAHAQNMCEISLVCRKIIFKVKSLCNGLNGPNVILTGPKVVLYGPNGSKINGNMLLKHFQMLMKH